MKQSSAKVLVLGLVFSFLLVACAGSTPTATPAPTPTPKAVAATPTPSALLKAKQEAEARGFIFETNHDEIVAKAKQEGKFRYLSSFDPENYQRMKEAFMKKYPFIDTYIQEITGTEASQRFVLELQAGAVKDWDVAHGASEMYNDFAPHYRKFDILAMAEQGVLAIPNPMIDAKKRSTVALGSMAYVVGYNKCVIDPAKLPNTWEDFLKPEFKGRKFVMDIRPKGLPEMMDLLGEAWVLDYAKKLAAQEPIWTRGQSRALTAMAAGEYALHQCVQYNTVMRAMGKDPTGCLQFKVIEPVPTGMEEVEGVLDKAPHPYAGLLWLEFASSPEGQQSVGLESSIYVPASAVGKVIAGKKIALSPLDKFTEIQPRADKLVEAYGFPKAEASK